MTLYKRSNGIYYLKYEDSEGIDRRRSTGKSKKTEALKFLKEFDKELEKTTTIKKSLNAIKTDYLTLLQKTYSHSHYRNTKASIERLLNSIRAQSITKISSRELSNFIHSRFEKSKHAAHLDFRNLRSFFNWCIKNNYLESNPLKGFTFPKIPEKENLFISPIEFESILNNEPNNLMKCIYQFSYYTGMRIGEVVNTRLSWIDLENRVIKIKNSESFITKSGKNRIVPICDKLYEIILKIYPKVIHISEDSYIFRKNGVKLREEYISKKFKKAVRKTFGNKTPYHFHNLRGSFGSELIKRGASTYYVMKLLGHSSITVTEKNYLSVTTNDLKAVVNLFN